MFSGNLLIGYTSELMASMGRRVWKAVALMVGLSLMEGIGLLLLVPLLHLVGLNVQEGGLGKMTQAVSSGFVAIGIQPTLITVLALYVLVTGVHALFRRWETTTNVSVHHEFVTRLRQRLFRSITNASWLFIVRNKGSDFSHVLTHEVERVGAATYQFLHLGATALVSAVYIGFALRLSLFMTLIVFGFGGGLIVLLRHKMSVARLTGEATSRAMSRLYEAITEHVGGMKIVKSRGAEDRHVQVFGHCTDRVHQSYIMAVRNQANVKFWFDLGAVLILSFTVYVAIEILSITTASVLLLLFLFARIIPKLSVLQQGYYNLSNLLPAFHSVKRMKDRCDQAAETRHGFEPVRFSREIRLQQACFSYGRSPWIEDLNLRIEHGQTAAIVGASGAGKTTVADMIIGLIRPARGELLIDGAPLRPEQLQGWRKQIGYVAQDPFLFHDTVGANLMWGAPAATDEEIWEALRLASAEELVRRLPHGLDTVVGDRGVRLSGGERQRLTLARALLPKPDLLVLDEATSNLDAENEGKILDSIAALRGSVTILIISHRLSAIRQADIIHVMEQGRLIESVSWEALTLTEQEGQVLRPVG